jgi:hypothetical protein
VVERFAHRRAQPLWGTRWKLVPCPAETGAATCATCRLCLDRPLLELGIVIGFAAHGTGARAAADKLVQIRRRSHGV